MSERRALGAKVRIELEMSDGTIDVYDYDRIRFNDNLTSGIFQEVDPIYKDAVAQILAPPGPPARTIDLHIRGLVDAQKEGPNGKYYLLYTDGRFAQGEADGD